MVLKQDLSQKESAGSGHFGVSLLFKENTTFPDRDTLLNILKKHLGDVTLMRTSETMAAFSADKYKVTIEGHELTPQLVLMKCTEIDKPLLDDIAATQLWDCEEAETILEECHYPEHAKMLTEYTEALMELFPACEAALFENSKKMHAREDIVNCDLPQDFRFIHYAVNVRFFRLEGSDDFIVDSLGMSMLDLPDVQYHFHGMSIDHVVNHAYALLSYMFDNGSVIKPGDTFDGIDEDGEITSEVHWQLNYEESLIQPAREVLDVNTGVYAAGDR